MARSFTAGEARRLVSEYRKLINSLEYGANVADDLEEQLQPALNEYLVQEALRILSEVPVEELNREKEGFRTNVLRDYGYETMADIYTANYHQLASLYGISEDSAWRMKKKAKEIMQATLPAARVRLSYDRQDARSTRLVQILAQYVWSRKAVWTCEKLLNFEKEKRQRSVELLAPATSGVRWLFTSQNRKDQAEVAYQNLYKLMTGQFRQTGEKAVADIHAAQNSDTHAAWVDFQRNTILYYNALEELAPGALGNTGGAYGLPEELAKEIQEEAFFPDGLKCTLRPYQEYGVKYILHQERVLLGDEMGLGKTIQAIATMVSLRNVGETHFMVVCPASVLSNWVKEISKHSKLRAIEIYGRGRKSALAAWMKTGGVAVTTYETTDALEFDAAYRFGMLVVDEAHYIKNPDAKRSQNVRGLCTHAKRLLFMTGTALENKVEEMISLIAVLQPEIAYEVQRIAFMSTAPQFREKVAPVYYRRKREDVLEELPEKIENEEWCRMGAIEESVYENAVMRKDYSGCRRVSWNVDDLRHSSKARRMLELIQDAEEDGRKIIVFTFFLETAKAIRQLLGRRCMDPINGSVPPARRQMIIEQFEKAPAGSVLVCQIQSGGTGLNIQAASVVIICEPQFKPSIENQAISRAYRMGQGRNVLVYRLLCVDTVDEKIMEMLEEKQAVFDAFADVSVAAQAQEAIAVDSTSFGKIIEEEIERIKQKNQNT